MSGRKQYMLWWIGFMGLGLSCLVGQSLISEKVLLHADRDFYASGETIWIKLYVTDAALHRPTSLSAIAHVELWQADGQIVLQTKVALDNGVGQASIDIPATQATGEYLLRAYTRWMANHSTEGFAHQPLIIFNPKEPIPLMADSLADQIRSEGGRSNNLAAVERDDLQIEVKLSQGRIGQREELRVDILTRDASGKPVSANLSLSAAKQIETDGLFASPYAHSFVKDIAPNSTEATQLPDLYGLNLSGSVRNDLGQLVAGAKVTLCLPGKIPLIRYATSSPEGWFRFLLPAIYGNRELIITAEDENGQNLLPSLDADILGDSPRLPQMSFAFPSALLPSLEEYATQAQLQEAFASAAPPSQSMIKPIEPFYDHADYVYKLDDYTRFDMEETFNEIVYSVILRKRKNQPYLRVIDPNTSDVMSQNPLVMIDGVPISDIRTLFTLPSKSVEKIEVMSYPYYLFDQILYGVVHVVTYAGDAKKAPVAEGSIRRPYAFLSPQRAFEYNITDARIPDLRRVLLWNPMIQTDETGKAQITLKSSDLEGEYEIQLRGMTKMGAWGESETRFSVERLDP